MLSMALSCGDRYQCVSFFLKHINDNDRDIIRRYTEALIINLSPAEAESFALNSQFNLAKIKENKDEFVGSILGQFVYGIYDENAFRYLSYRNILESNKLMERFNAGISLNRSLEHIHPKSKVYHADENTGKILRGDNVPVVPEIYSYPDSMPKGIIKRDDIRGNNQEGKIVTLSEHSICNLVLLYGRDNSAFGNKDFEEKKEILFNVNTDKLSKEDDRKKIVMSRTLQHTLSKFSKSKWTVAEMIVYYNETAVFLNKVFLHETNS